MSAHPSKEQDMVKVAVQAEGGRYSAVITNDRIGYTFVGEEFEAGQPVLGDKLAKAGLDVEPGKA
jgi:hypothetical protein